MRPPSEAARPLHLAERCRPYGLGRRPQFVIVARNDTFRVTLAAVIATYGQPVSVTAVTNDVMVARLPG